MASTDTSNGPELAQDGLSVGDFAVVINRDIGTNGSNWSLVLYAAEDNLVEAKYQSSQDAKEQCIWGVWMSPIGVTNWIEGLRSNCKTSLTCRLPFVARGNATTILEDIAKKSSGKTDECRGKGGRASIDLVLKSLVASGEQPLIEIELHSRLMQKLDGLEREFLKGQKNGVVDVK